MIIIQIKNKTVKLCCYISLNSISVNTIIAEVWPHWSASCLSSTSIINPGTQVIENLMDVPLTLNNNRFDNSPILARFLTKMRRTSVYQSYLLFLIIICFVFNDSMRFQGNKILNLLPFSGYIIKQIKWYNRTPKI